MKKKNLLRKQELANKVSMQFNEVAEIFSEETLESIFLIQIVGGEGTNAIASCGCNSSSQCGCTIQNNVASCGCGSGGSGKGSS